MPCLTSCALQATGVDDADVFISPKANPVHENVGHAVAVAFAGPEPDEHSVRLGAQAQPDRRPVQIGAQADHVPNADDGHEPAHHPVQLGAEANVVPDAAADAVAGRRRDRLGTHRAPATGAGESNPGLHERPVSAAAAATTDAASHLHDGTLTAKEGLSAPDNHRVRGFERARRQSGEPYPDRGRAFHFCAAITPRYGGGPVVTVQWFPVRWDVVCADRRSCTVQPLFPFRQVAPRTPPAKEINTATG